MAVRACPAQVAKVVEMPENDDLSLLEASRWAPGWLRTPRPAAPCLPAACRGGAQLRAGCRVPCHAVLGVAAVAPPAAACPPPLPACCRICNRKIISEVQQVICFAFHDSRLLLETCAESKEAKKIVTLFYLD
jgi:hypothetical protein